MAHKTFAQPSVSFGDPIGMMADNWHIQMDQIITQPDMDHLGLYPLTVYADIETCKV